MKLRTTSHGSSALLAALCWGICLGAHAQTVIFTEDFESPALTDPPHTTQTTNGIFSAGWLGVWTGTAGSWLRPSATSVWLNPVPAELGAQFATLYSGGSLFTDLTDTYAANTIHTLTFTHFRRDNQPGDAIKVDLMTTGGAVVATATFAAVTDTGTYVPRTLSFDTATGSGFNGQNIRIRFTDPNGGTATTGQAAIDNIELATVPVIDLTPPTITGLVPQGEGVYPGGTLVATFSENIALTGSGTITITDTDDGSGTRVINLPDPSRVTVSGADLHIDPGTRLGFGTNFEVVISGGSIEDTASTPNAFAGTSSGQWIFRTAEENLSAPVITVKSPDDDALDVGIGTNIVATFDDPVIAGQGDITLRDLTAGSTTRTFAATDTSQVTISGNVLTIDPATPLAADTDYAVQIDAGAVKNYSDVPFAGIPASDETTWNFRTRSQGPNVIFILGDDQAWYDYSFMRRPGVEKAAIDMDSSIPQVAKTPAIDRLADEGLTFVHGYSAPVCRPSLSSIITGTHPHQHRITGNDPAIGHDRMQVLNPLPRTLAHQLGYTSFQTGKWWEGHFANGGFTHGDTVRSIAAGTAPPQWGGSRPSYVNAARHGDWGLMAGRVDYVNDIQAPAHPIPYANTIQTVTDFINIQVAAGQPFFLWYAPFLPHTPHDPPAGLLAEYTALGLGNADARYYANIERFDGGVGAILDHLVAQGIADNTIVVMICDNGRQYDLATLGKLTPYETGARTPLIVRWPDRIKPGGAIEPGIIRAPVSQVDMVPTVHHALGLSTFPEMSGIDLLDPAAVASRRTVCGSNHLIDIQDLQNPRASLTSRFAVRDGWKLIRFTNGTTELYQLYDTATGAPVDPHETNDLSASYPQLVSELSVALANFYTDEPNDFDSWIKDPVLGIAPAERGIDLDPDGDGLTNGIEAWFGSHPGEFTAGLTHIVAMDGTASFQHPLNPNPPGDLTGSYEWSPNLVDWYAGNGVEGPGGGPTVDIVSSTAGTITTVSATTSLAIPRLFLRVKVTQD